MTTGELAALRALLGAIEGLAATASQLLAEPEQGPLLVEEVHEPRKARWLGDDGSDDPKPAA